MTKLAGAAAYIRRKTSRYDLRTARIKADGSTNLFRYDPAGQVTAAAYGQHTEGRTLCLNLPLAAEYGHRYYPPRPGVVARYCAPLGRGRD